MNFKYAMFFIILLSSAVASSQGGDKVIQINISKLLNARTVTTVAGGKLQSWVTGIDGGGKGDGYLTMAAALLNGDKAVRALPDDPLIAANSAHPAILLHYKNGKKDNQARCIAGADSFSFDVPQKKYSGLYLSLTSSEGPSQLHITLIYSDGSEFKGFKLPDYYNDIPEGNSNLSYLVHGLAKWGPGNKITENDHHNIDVLNIHPDPGRILKKVTVSKDKAGYLVFWAATGVTE
ncbi:hypothetical protein DIU31_030735 [Mucilaginibacter rubeus]|uniref:Uncharacterized protein n=1 Tax=Mucilaginibacter rubeus TaxID=2027860 RepID=A0AAE6JLR0_9SPHI|nr:MULTISPECIES: hypothetical protein [Mucilaginibacter]QEM07663.1 hypothetical protein DIU31_030735 [Mucilaginibacter rubeus]QEM20118.1 hypothetical protein DIU38_030340 [Mucilaginibacter gossypii]QTE43171.1 hypothetical protein J3L19_30320 [Mucilaginibacter rubeus]QTE49771.1 hypothetical protein J3L21_30275 [Mucilaginibacter rubeus]QTE54865.1 hypothetical protein J3L23_21895 [Mucilaginibacter rubeus]